MSNNFEFSKKFSVYQPIDEAVFPIPEADWQRLKRLIGNVVPQRRLYQVLCSLSFGVFCSSVIAVIPLLANSSTLPSWVLPVTFSFMVVSLILGIALCLMDGQQKQLISASSQDVIVEMEELEKRYYTPPEDHAEQ